MSFALGAFVFIVGLIIGGCVAVVAIITGAIDAVFGEDKP